ncbi:MAG: hypothetical protein GX434_16905 [Peptococcaceae bacterium]|nr:hypothetical protein [Peptococcaceae bacterium]
MIKINPANEKKLYTNQGEPNVLPGDKDYLLRWLISRIETEKLSLNITLNIKGIVISGSIISEKEYCERLVHYLNDISEIKGIAPMGRNHWAETNRQDAEPLQEEYIHLKNAKIYFSSIDSAPLDEGVLWRGKLSTVDGFILGLFRSYP